MPTARSSGAAPSERARQAERAAERRALVRAAWVCVGLVLVVYVVDALSIATELERVGRRRPASYPWVIEGTAVLAIFAALPVALWTGQTFPPERWRWKTALPAHAAGLIVYALAQVLIMSGLRLLVWGPLYGAPFEFGDSPAGVFIYEFRKQAAAYLGFQVVLAVSRHVEQLRLEAAAARAEARSEQRVTLKCGGRAFHLDAGEFVAAKAAGNYVEARFGPREHLARMTLSELESLLHEADIDVARVHRSWLVNRAAITETAPDGQGGLVITLADGTTAPGSRRYRAALVEADADA